MTTKLLANQLQGIIADPVEGFTVELADESSLFEWRVYIEGPKETCYEGGVFQLSLNFPKDYPMNPPVLKFISDFWHPNVYSDGKVCMSILHPPGDDAMSGELARERWLPTQSVTTIVLSLMSLLNDPNCSSPANVDASVEWRKNKTAYIQKCKKLVERANREKPPHVVIPHPDTDENEHRRIVQKWKEMNSGMDAEEFYEPNEEDDDDEAEDSDEENEDEDDLVESNGEIDSEGEGENVEKKKDGAEKVKKDNEAPITTTTSAPSQPLIPTPSTDQVPSSSTPPLTPSSSTSTAPPSSSSSSTNPPAIEKVVEERGSSSKNQAVVKEEISVEPVPIPSSSGPNPSTSGPTSSSGPITSSGPSNNNNASANNASPPSSPRGKKSKKGKKKKCIIM